MELGFVICAQIFVLAAVSIVPMMVLKQHSERCERAVATTRARPQTLFRRS